MTTLNQHLRDAKHFPRHYHASYDVLYRHSVRFFVARRTIECAELAVGNADVCIVQDDVVDERDGVAKEPLPQSICHQAHRVDVVRFHQPDAIAEAKPAARQSIVKHVADFRFFQEIS